MKKLFALLLAAIMLLSTIPFVASATGDAAATPTEVSSLADFYWVKRTVTPATDTTPETVEYALTNALDIEGSYKLLNDITFGDDTTVALRLVEKNAETDEYEFVYTDANKTEIVTHDWTFANLDRGLLDGGFEGTFDGDGHSIVYTGNFKKESSGGFLVNSGSFSGTLKNLTLGSKTNPINALMGKASGGSNCGILAAQTGFNLDGVLVENVVVYADLAIQGTGARNVGFLIGKTLAGITFSNVRCYGTLDVQQSKDNQGMGIGGIVGMHVCNAGDAGPIYFNNCYTDVDIRLSADPLPAVKEGNSGVGGLLGINKCTNGDTEFYATNCVSVGDLPDITNLVVGAGGLIGATYGAANVTAEELEIITDCQKPVFNAVGASVKIDDATLRFRAGVAVYNAAVDIYGAENVKMGVIIADKATAEALGENFKIGATGVTNVEATEIENGNIYATVAVTAANYGTEYTALGYISFTTDGTNWTTDYATATTTRSVSYVATAALADVKDAAEGAYMYANADGKYCLYTAEQQTKLASYVVASAS